MAWLGRPADLRLLTSVPLPACLPEPGVPTASNTGWPEPLPGPPAQAAKVEWVRQKVADWQQSLRFEPKQS